MWVSLPRAIVAKKAAPTVAPSAMSVVAKPASASIVGSKVKGAVARTAIALPNEYQDQPQTTRHANKKNGRLPSRIRNIVRSTFPERAITLAPSCVRTRIAQRPSAFQVRSKGLHHARKRRVLRFIAVYMFC